MDGRANVVSRLTSKTSSAIARRWSGPLTGSFSHDVRAERQNPLPMITATVNGAGAPVNKAAGVEGSQVELSMDLRDCSYRVDLVVHGHVISSTNGKALESDALIGSARSGTQLLAAHEGAAGINGSETLTSHSTLWGLSHDGGAYFGTLASAMDGRVFTKGGTGAASVQWAITRIR